MDVSFKSKCDSDGNRIFCFPGNQIVNSSSLGDLADGHIVNRHFAMQRFDERHFGDRYFADRRFVYEANTSTTPGVSQKLIITTDTNKG